MIYKTKPWEHQKRAIEFALDKPSVGIFMEMGTGKTKVAIDLLNNRRNKRILIVCPKRVLKVWPREFEKHSANDYNIIPLNKGTGTDKAKLVNQLRMSPQQRPLVIITNYDMVWREPLAKELLKFKFDTIVLDESHRIKKPGGKASRFCHRLGKITPWKMALTGTPMAHSPLDIYGQYRFLDQSIFGTNFEDFKSQYVKMGGKDNRIVIKHINQEELHQKMYDIAFRVKTREVLDLPSFINDYQEIEFSPAMMKMYKEFEKESVVKIEEGVVMSNNVLAQLTRLQQMTSGITVNRDGEKIRVNKTKINHLEDMLEDIDVKEPIVIFARFTDDLEAIGKLCEDSGRKYAEVSGRKDQLSEWQNGKYDVIGVQIQAGAEGEDYTRSRYVIYYSLGYSLKDYQQSRARVDRPGQTRNQIFIHIIIKGTVDEKVMSALRQNKNVVDYVLDELRKGQEEKQK